jgi:2-polyprenyl-6-methoxyphenol hydroxylase-like FAD-dependent oxidoreductase
MSGIVVCGAGVCGLTTAMLLAKDGHQVTVLERDPAAPPDPGTAWDEWERRGVNQFRLPHFLLPGFRDVMEAELPEILDALMAAGANRMNLLGIFAEAMDPKGEHVVVTARRPIVEAVFAAVAASIAGVTIHRGTAIAGLELDGRRVTGVRTEAGEVVPADLVVDAGGRRSPLARWLTEAGLPAPTVEEEECGLVYYGRHVRTPDGADAEAPVVAFHGSIGLLFLPADHGTIGVGLIASSKDADLRALRHDAPWLAALALVPGGEDVLRCEAISPLVAMGGIEDRWRRFVVDGEPVATGVVSVADAWAATNPTLGRGISLGSRHAVALRDVVRQRGADDHEGVARAFDAVTQERFTPWYEATIWHDRHRLADLDDAIAGTQREPDPEWTTFRRFEGSANADPNLVLRMFEGLHLRETPLALIRDPEIVGQLDAMGAKVPPPTGPTRGELLDAIRRVQ